MATVKLNGKTVRAKVKPTRNPLLVDEKYLGNEPEWNSADCERMPPDIRANQMRHAFRYYNYFYNQKDLKKYVVEWLKEGKYLEKEELSAYIRTRDRLTLMTACSLVKMHKQGLPFQERETEFVLQAVKDAIKYAQDSGEDDEAILAEEKKEEPKAKAYVPTIQDRLNEKTAEHIGYFEGLYDEIVEGRMAVPKAYDYLTTNNVPQSQIGKFEAVFSARKAELEEAQAGTEEQIKEAYKHYKAADFKKHLHFLDSILSELDQYRQVKKATKKVRVKKAPSKEKVVAKLKFAKDDKVLKLVSINPADIIGAKELWVYNSKTRKLGKYVADELHGPLNVKGTSIIGFDEAKSITKTLRKPEEKLKEFTKASKVELRKFLENIKATETKLNGRINTDIVLLKAQ
jgi:hypothetical protein